MEWLYNLIKNNPFKALVLPTGLSGFDFVLNIINALSDGKIDGSETHQLLSSASAVETVLLVLIMLALRGEKK